MLTSKERAELKKLAANEKAILQLGKNNLTPEVVASIREALDARELVKISILDNSTCDPNETAQMIAERTKSDVVQVIGKKIVLYKKDLDKKDPSNK